MGKVSWLLIVIAAGCGGSAPYAYRPATPSHRPSSASSADFQVPAAAPHGEVHLSALGLTGATKATAPELHVRLVVANRDDPTPWQIDMREVTVFVNCDGWICSEHAKNDGQTPTVVELAPGQQRTVDLDFVLPPKLRDATKVPAFVVAWRVHTGTGVVRQSTEFRRAPRDGAGWDDFDNYDDAHDDLSGWIVQGQPRQ